MPQKCYYRPNRTRVRKFSEKDAGRIVCRVLSEGGDPDKLKEEIEKCLDLCDKERIRSAVLEILEKSQALTAALGTIIVVASTIALGVAIISRIPFVRQLLLPATRQLEQAKSALEQGLTIESTAQRILDQLL